MFDNLINVNIGMITDVICFWIRKISEHSMLSFKVDRSGFIKILRDVENPGCFIFLDEEEYSLRMYLKIDIISVETDFGID